MKRAWIFGGATLVVMLLLVALFRLRPSPQDELWRGVQNGNMALIQKAMSRGADATLPAGPGNKFNLVPGYTPLQVYLMHGSNLDTLKMLLQKADLSVQSETGRLIPLDMEDGLYATPLHFVTIEANNMPKQEGEQLLQLFLTRGAPVNAKAKTPAGLTPLMLAQEEWVVRALLDAGADPDMVAANGACIMNFMGKEPKYNALWRLLKKKGARPRRVPDSLRFPRPVWSRTEHRIERWGGQA